MKYAVFLDNVNSFMKGTQSRLGEAARKHGKEVSFINCGYIPEKLSDWFLDDTFSKLESGGVVFYRGHCFDGLAESVFAYVCKPRRLELCNDCDGADAVLLLTSKRMFAPVAPEAAHVGRRLIEGRMGEVFGGSTQSGNAVVPVSCNSNMYARDYGMFHEILGHVLLGLDDHSPDYPELCLMRPPLKLEGGAGSLAVCGECKPRTNPLKHMDPENPETEQLIMESIREFER
jgi:hypothetical protein